MNAYVDWLYDINEDVVWFAPYEVRIESFMFYLNHGRQIWQKQPTDECKTNVDTEIYDNKVVVPFLKRIVDRIKIVIKRISTHIRKIKHVLSNILPASDSSNLQLSKECY